MLITRMPTVTKKPLHLRETHSRGREPSRAGRLAASFLKFRRSVEVPRCIRFFDQWRLLTWAYIAAGKLDYPFRVTTRAGHTLTLEDWSEVTTLWHVYCAQEYQLRARAELVVDLGANFGAFSLLTAERLPGVRVIAVEPFPSTYSRLTDMIEQNSLADTITPVMAAINSHDTNVHMNAQADGHSYARKIVNETTEHTVEVPAMTLSTLFRTHQLDQIDFLKVDIEGGEYALLANCDPELLRQCQTIAMEYHDVARRQVIWDRLEAAGFECVRHHPGGWSGLAEFRRI